MSAVPGPTSFRFTSTARRLGRFSAIWVATLLTAYAMTLAAGLASLESPDDPVGGAAFTALEVLIIALVPGMVSLMVAVHAWASHERKPLSLTALAFMTVLAGITSMVHAVVLTVSRHPAFANMPALHRTMSFEWPSAAYALDILAWDVFFALSMLFAAPVFSGSRLARSVRLLMIASGVLALAGLSGVATGDMRLRNIGIVGYVPVFLVIVILLAVLFHRTPAVTDRADR
ncbi:MAG TPA: hypothetical protein VK922_16945 [Gemmatimonadaceae bacterium]|nr:hypothetical protein [Gemmatimonadaceae bacterium]